MSARIESRPVDRIGRVVMVAAVAGLTGVAITLVAAVTLLLNAATGSSQAQVQSGQLVPAYDDYGLRHSFVVQAAPIGTASDDYGLRHSFVVQAAPIGTASDDYGLRHPLP